MHKVLDRFIRNFAQSCLIYPEPNISILTFTFFPTFQDGRRLSDVTTTKSYKLYLFNNL